MYYSVQRNKKRPIALVQIPSISPSTPLLSSTTTAIVSLFSPVLSSPSASVIDIPLNSTRRRHIISPSKQVYHIPQVYYSRRMSFLKAHYHPLLFGMMTLSAMAEIGLTAFLITAGNENETWPTARYHSLLILLLFNAVWTILFSVGYLLWMMDGGIRLLASIASSVIWLLITSILWGTATGVMHNTRTGGNCALRPVIHRCRQSLTVEALGWTEFGLCLLTLILTCVWVKSDHFVRKDVKAFKLESSGESTRRLVQV